MEKLLMKKKLLCVDIGGTRIKFSVLPSHAKISDTKISKLYHLRTLGWLNDSFSELFSKDHWSSVISKTKNDEYSSIALCINGPVKDGRYFQRDDLVSQGVPKDLKAKIERVSHLPIEIVKDADAWAVGIDRYMDMSKMNVEYPVLVLAFGTGAGASLIKKKKEVMSIEISKTPCKFKNLSASSGNIVNESWKVHNRIGSHFFDWISNEKKQWSYKSIRNEYTKRVIGFIRDLQKILISENHHFKTVILCGGNSEYVSTRQCKNENISENIISFWEKNIDINPDFIPLLGLSHLDEETVIIKSPW